MGLRQRDETIPDYVALMPGDAQKLAPGAPVPGTPRLAEDSVLTLELRPQARVPGKVVVHAFLQQDGSLRPWPVTLASSPQGVLRLQAPVHELPGLHAGHTELVFAIGRDHGGAAPTAAQIDAALRHEPPSRVGGWQVVHQPLDIGPSLP